MSEELAPTPNTGVKQEHSLLIDLVFQRSRRFVPKKFKWKTVDNPVQLEPFRIGLKITNIGKLPFPGCSIADFRIHAGQNSPFYQFISSTHSVTLINPNDHEVVWLDDLITKMQGPLFVKCKVIPSVENVSLTTYQKGIHDVIKYADEPNNWGGPLFVVGQMESQQKLTNRLLVGLTILIFLDGMFGLDTIATGVLTAFQWLFLSLGGLIGKLI